MHYVINEIITFCVDMMKLYMFLAVEIFVVKQSVNVYIYLCVCIEKFDLCVCVHFCALVQTFSEPITL